MSNKLFARFQRNTFFFQRAFGFFQRAPLHCCAWHLLLLMHFATTSLAQAQPNMRALLIAIGDYPVSGGWRKINATNDLGAIGAALQKRGFPAPNIVTLTDAQATKEGIVGSIRADLLEKLQAGDVAYFQFSGHGQQVADDNGDELDGFDEAIVPYDSPMDYQAGQNEGEKLLRDDELGSLLTDIRRRLGPTGNLMVVMDACHSGTGTRGMETARGTDRIMASPHYLKNMAKRPGNTNAPDPFASGTASDELAPMAAFFGSAQNQLNFETRDEEGHQIGSLSYALAKKMSQTTPATTYRGLFEQIKIDMSATAPRQQPQAEGTLDQEMLGGNLRENQAFYRVVHWDDPGHVGIDAGWMHGLNEGSIIGFFAAETRTPKHATPLATGTITAARPFEATVRLDQELPQALAQGSWAYLLEQNFGNLNIGLHVKMPQEHPHYAALMEKIAAYPVIQLDAAPELFVTANATETQLWSGNDYLLESVKANVSPNLCAEQLLKRVLSYAQAKFLRKMDAQSAVLKVSMEIVPLTLDARTLNVVGRPPLSQKMDAAGNVHFQNNDAIRIRIRNDGEKAAYFTLLDIQPDNEIAVLLPGKAETPAEYRIGPGQSVEVANMFEICPPAGLEVFKLIATEQPVDLRPIASSRGGGLRANQGPLEQLFAQTYFQGGTQSRGGKTISLASGSCHVFSATFIIDGE